MDSIFAGYTLKQLLMIGGAIIALLIVFTSLKKFFTPEKKDKHRQSARCDNCGWQGTVSVYAGRCPECNKPLGQRKARKY